MNKQKGNVLVIVLVAIILLSVASMGVVMFLSYDDNQTSQSVASDTRVTQSEVVSDEIASSSNQEAPVTTKPSAATPTKTLPAETVAISSNDLWVIFDKLKMALKNKDIVAFNSLSYDQMSSTEADQFSQFATFFYGELNKLNKADFVNQWQDDRQAIFSTNPVRTDTAEDYSYKQSKVFFIKDKGLWKLLSIDYANSGSVPKSWGVQGEKDLIAKTVDSDKDGLTDQSESCSGWQESNPNCVKTDPNKRDTDGDGWWDGIETNMK